MQPPIPGPKLHPFAGKLDDIEFLGTLGEGIHGVVHCVAIDGCEFALKVVRYNPPRYQSLIDAIGAVSTGFRI